MTLAFAPDAPPTTPEVLTAVEMIPSMTGYKAAASGLSAGYSALAASPLGAALLLQLDGNYRIFAGTGTRLYEASGSSWTDRSAGGVAYSTTASPWRFAAFGNTSLAANKVAALQYSNSGAFAAVTAPKAALVEVCQGFVILADCDDTGAGLGTSYGDQPHRWWCGQSFNATGTFAPSVTTQATTGLLVDAPGKITALKRLGGNCIAYKGRSIFIGTYVGPPVVWQWQLVPGDIGAPSQESVVSIGTAHVFIGYEDIYLFDGSRPVPIGAGVKTWFFNRLNKSYAHLIQGSHDAVNGLVYWAYPSGQSTSCDSVLVYNYKTQRFGHITLSTPCMAQTVSAAVTYDNFASALGVTNYDDVPAIPYDSPFFQAGAPVVAYFDTSFVLKTLTGTAGSSSLTTGLIGEDQQVSLCWRVRPRFRTPPSSASIVPSGYFQHGATASVGASAAINGDRFDVLQSARWHAFAMSFTGECDIEGVLPSLRKQGQE